MRYLWYSMYVFVTALAVHSLLFSPLRRSPGTVRPAPSPPYTVPLESPRAREADVQIALLLDTSSSMDGLIEQARVQLWEMVGELQRNGDDEPRQVEVALIQYGNSRFPESDGFVELLSPLTTDLDAVSLRLQALSTSGGKEYAPRAILRAVEELDWSADDSVERVVVVAGNEGFGQGPVATEDALEQARRNKIKVIPIFCASGGATSTGLGSWQRAARLAESQLATIDPDRAIEKPQTPFDDDLVAKCQALEANRLSYGDPAYQREVESVSYGASHGTVGSSVALQAERAVARSRQEGPGDLIRDEGDVVSLDGLTPDQLPSALRGLPRADQLQLLEERRRENRALRQEIEALSTLRRQHLDGAAASSSAPSLGSSVRHALAR